MEGTYGCEQPRSDSEQSKIPTTRVRTVLLGTVAVDRIWADYAFTAAGSQILILRVSGIRNRLSTKHTAGTAIG
jgi:hypothetical protein